MNKFFIFLALIALGFSQDPIEDLPDFTPPVSIRSIYSGDILMSKDSKKPTPNWLIKEVFIPELAKMDFVEITHKLGYVQFKHPEDENICIGIDESGFFMDKDCKQDIADKKYETVFSLMPTNTGAVQIRSLVQERGECISVFLNPQLPKGRDFGIKPCGFSALALIELEGLMFIAPPFGTSVINN